jgi:hypothetical protein
LILTFFFFFFFGYTSKTSKFIFIAHEVNYKLRKLVFVILFCFLFNGREGEFLLLQCVEKHACLGVRTMRLGMDARPFYHGLSEKDHILGLKSLPEQPLAARLNPYILQNSRIDCSRRPEPHFHFFFFFFFFWMSTQGKGEKRFELVTFTS